MRKKLLVIIALGGALAIVAAGSASSLSVGTTDVTGTVPGSGGEVSTGGTTTTPPTQCSNLADDDGDGLVDLADPGCSGPLDTDEYNAPTGGSGGSGSTTSTTGSTTTAVGPSGRAQTKPGRAGPAGKGLTGTRAK